MKHMKVKREYNRTTIIHKFAKQEQLNQMEWDIISKGEIPTLAHIQFRSSFGGKKLIFTINDLMDLRSFLKSRVSFGDFMNVVQQIIQTIRSCQSYGVRTSNLEMNLDYIYINTANKTICMLYWPLISLDQYADEMKCFQEIGNVYECRTSDNPFREGYCDYFNGREIFDLFRFEKALKSLQKQWKNAYNTYEESDIVIKPLKRPRSRMESLMREDTIAMVTSSLLQVSTDMKIDIRKFPFSIGRDASVCSYAVENNRSVSNMHLTLYERNGTVFAKDEKSLNGTRIDGVLLVAGEEVEVKSGCLIELGTEEFIFFDGDGKR